MARSLKADPPLALDSLLHEVRACTACGDLPCGPRPVLQVARTARVLIMGQAPGRKVHETGVAWSDASGERLRDWMGIDWSHFYDKDCVAIVPMGFCYPGRSHGGGDKPPRRECAPLWHARLLEHLGGVRLTLLVGHHAQRFYLPSTRTDTMTETVRSFGKYAPGIMPLPHPSWRSAIWMRRNPGSSRRCCLSCAEPCAPFSAGWRARATDFPTNKRYYK